MAEIGQRKVLVVGASRGIGRTVGRSLAGQGAHVAFAGRSRDLLAEAVSEHPGRSVAVECDVRDPEACEAAIDAVVEVLGGLDALVYATGITHFAEMAQTTTEQWRAVFDTNVIGAASITRAALPQLTANQGNAIYLSSDSASRQPPWHGIGAYVCSKVALEQMVQCWHHENPLIAFTTLSVGPTVSSVRDRHPEGARFGADWLREGLITGRQLHGVEHAAMIAHILTTPARIASATVVPR